MASIKNGMMLWTDSYLADTGHLTTLEHGAYLLILMAMWRTPNGRLPNDRIRLARCAKMSPDKWRHVEKNVMALLMDEGATVTQKRLLQEREIALCKSEKSRSAALLRYRPKPLKDNEPAPADASPGHMPNSLFADAPNPNPAKKKEVSKRERATRLSPQWTATERGIEFAISKGFTRLQAKIMEGAMLNFYTVGPGGNTKWIDWYRCWQGWVNRERGFQDERKARYGGKEPYSRKPTRSETILAASRQFAAEMARDGTGPEVSIDGTGPVERSGAPEYFPPVGRH